MGSSRGGAGNMGSSRGGAGNMGSSRGGAGNMSSSRGGAGNMSSSCGDRDRVRVYIGMLSGFGLRVFIRFTFPQSLSGIFCEGEI